MPIKSMLPRFVIERHGPKETPSAATAKLIPFKLITAAAIAVRRLKGENELPKLVEESVF
jgi:hypothetical protein